MSKKRYVVELSPDERNRLEELIRKGKSQAGIHRDPVRSSHGHFVTTSGLRWLSVMALVPVPWTWRRWAMSS